MAPLFLVGDGHHKPFAACKMVRSQSARAFPVMEDPFVVGCVSRETRVQQKNGPVLRGPSPVFGHTQTPVVQWISYVCLFGWCGICIKLTEHSIA